MKKILCFVFISVALFGQSKILINMDLNQTDHLKAYGITFSELQNGNTCDWLLNYRGGSFLLNYSNELASKCRIKGVSFEILSIILNISSLGRGLNLKTTHLLCIGSIIFDEKLQESMNLQVLV